MTNNEITEAARYSVGERVMYQGRACTIVRAAKPIRFDIGMDSDRHIEIVPAFDLIAGDDVDSFDAAYYPRIQQSSLRAR